MATKNRSHGVVVVYVASTLEGSRVHRPETEGMHGTHTMTTPHWELFPNLDTAKEAGYPLCPNCFPQG